MKNLLVLSGGLDSTAALHIHKDTIHMAISFDYGSKHNGREIAHAIDSCDSLGIPHQIIKLKQVMKHMKSSLLSGEVPEGHYADDNMKSTVVPFRNAIMLSIATGIADSNNLDGVIIATHKGDFAQYPDCTVAFNAGIKVAMYAGTHNGIQLMAPFAALDKREIATLGVDAGMIPSNTYSCYKGGENHCGKCGTCVERIWALRFLDDKTQYENTTFAIIELKKSGEWK